MSNPLIPNKPDNEFSEVNDGCPCSDKPNKKRWFKQTEQPPYIFTDAMSVVANPCLRKQGVTPPIIWTNPD